VHDPTDVTHLLGNISRFFAAAILICIMIWYLHKRGVFFPERFYKKSITLFLLGVPFIISIVSLMSGRMQNIGYIFGFSGIVWAYIGFLLLLIALAVGANEIEMFEGLRHHYVLWPPLLFTSFLTCTAPIVLIFYLFGSHWTNMFGHLAGLFSGMMIPFLFLNMHFLNFSQRKQENYKNNAKNSKKRFFQR
jgi:hypothetical protein